MFLIISGTLEGNGSILTNGSSVRIQDGEPQANGGQGGSVYVCSESSSSGITISANGGNALQVFDSLQSATVRGLGGEGGIIRTEDLQSFKCIAEGGFHASVGSIKDGILILDSAKAASGVVTVSDFNPYSRDPGTSTKLEFFAATSVNASVHVSWVTASEVNVDYFTIERSIDASPFIPVFKINGKGNAGGKSNYHFEDVAQTAADCQYRLTQTSFDNHTEIFPSVRLKQQGITSDSKLISVQPNPFGDQFTIQCIIAEPGIVEITLTDISGNIIRRETAVAAEGKNAIPVNNLSNLPKGTYFLSMSAGIQKLPTVKILK